MHPATGRPGTRNQGVHACTVSCFRRVLTLRPHRLARQAPVSMGFSTQEYRSGLPCRSFSRGSSRPRDWTWVSCIGRWILYHPSHLGSQQVHIGRSRFSSTSSEGNTVVGPWVLGAGIWRFVQKVSWTMVNGAGSRWQWMWGEAESQGASCFWVNE